MKDDLRVPGLEPDIPFRIAATIILEAKAQSIFALEKTVRSGKDAEALHDMRVASRRLREAMEIFQACYEPTAFKKHYRAVRRVTRTLGTARNLDVCIDFLSGLRKHVQEEGEQEVVSYLLSQQKKERKRAHKKMVRKMDKLDLKGLEKSLCAFFSNPVSDREAEENQDMASRARTIVKDRLENVFGYREAIEDEPDVDALHQMRIATKKLRYTMETLYIAFDHNGFDKIYGAVKGLQERLGNIHDLDVFMDMVGDAKEKAEDRKRTRALVPGMIRVRERIRAQRHELYKQFMGFIQGQDHALKAQILHALRVGGGGSSHVE